MPQQVLDVEDADDVVRVLVVNGDAGVALFDDLAFYPLEGAGVRQGEHFGAGGHHGAGFSLAEGYDAFQDAFFPIFVQFAAGGHSSAWERLSTERVSCGRRARIFSSPRLSNMNGALKMRIRLTTTVIGPEANRLKLL